MSAVKCIGCGRLERDSQEDFVTPNPKFPLVIYNCTDGRFPYWCATSGLLRPSGGVEKAAAGCPVRLSSGCIICGAAKNLTTYWVNKAVYICHAHDRAWSKWLDDHPGLRESFSPRGRVLQSRWVEVFRKWVAEAKEEAKI